MKKDFTPEYIRDNKGCYSSNQVNELSFIKKELISLEDILKSEISIRDKRWFIWNKCELTLDQKKLLALKLARVVSSIYNEKYPNDNRINECLDATEGFLKGEISREELNKKNAYAAAAYAADAYATAYAAAAYAAYAAYAADAADADAAAYAADAAAYAAAAYAADAESETNYKLLLQETMIEFIKLNEE